MSLLLTLTVQAQKLTVEKMAQDASDLSARTYGRHDVNDKPCALVKVQLAVKDAVFEGNVIGSVDYKTGEYWVYMSEGSRELRIKHPNFLPLHVNFMDYGLGRQGVRQRQTYTLTLVIPQASASVREQTLIINYSPADAMVLIDSEPYQGKGRIEKSFPLGNHSYIIAAQGYETAEGSVKLNGGSPRTITEHLVAKSRPVQVQQHQTVVATPVQPVASVAENPASNPIETITVNGVSFNMVRVEGGTFTMGATSEQGSDAFDDEKPAHQVTLSTYSIGETEVTQALWEKVMGKNPSKYKGSNRPVETVSWDDCQAFIQKLNALTGRRFRLPTEAEWEYAARGGNRSRGYKYSGSNNIADVAWYTETTNRTGTRDVKTKQANELGIYDMSGNVEEWCQDWKDSYSSGSQTNPTGPSSGSNRVKRGGSWWSSARYCRASYRGNYSPSLTGSNLGLRLAL